jgi:hypothetical protein
VGFAQKVWNTNDAVGGCFIFGLNIHGLIAKNPTDAVGGWFFLTYKPSANVFKLVGLLVYRNHELGDV